MATGQWLVGGDGVQWHFESGAVSLDFGYTGDWELGVPAWERLHTPADLTAWLREHVDRHVSAAHSEDLDQALALRASITAIAWALSLGRTAPGEAVALLDGHAAQADIPPQLAGSAPAQGWEPARALATLARDAVALFGGPPERIRQCAAGDCRLVFVDTSRPGRRRWCSMQRCGNRAKMRTRNTRSGGPDH
jgi:predicted RNA-binding Zn ribbon-like protein